jgi:hypothetical protein
LVVDLPEGAIRLTNSRLTTRQQQVFYENALIAMLATSAPAANKSGAMTAVTTSQLVAGSSEINPGVRLKSGSVSCAADATGSVGWEI